MANVVVSEMKGIKNTKTQHDPVGLSMKKEVRNNKKKNDAVLLGGNHQTIGNASSRNKAYVERVHQMEFNRREQRGLAIVAKGGMIKRVDGDTFLVKSSDLENSYKVSWNGRGWICECKDFEKRVQSCKHVYAVLFLGRLPYILMANFQSNDVRCPKCNSNLIIRKGLVHNKEFAAQRYFCKKCNEKFTDKGESKGLKGNPLAVTAAVDLYFKGISLRMIEDHLNKIYSLNISYPTIHRWIKGFVKNMKALEEEHSLKVGKRWHIDETEVKIAGKLHYLWNVLDAETRILLASQVTFGRSAKDAEMIIREALKNAKTKPNVIVTDGLRSYNVAMTKNYGCKIKHVSKPRFSDKVNNNIVERVNGTLKTRIKGFRRLDNLSASAELFDGLRLYYNSMRPHSALGGKTPVAASSQSGQK
jgi:putative transposase